jgi:hypothetical protein
MLGGTGGDEIEYTNSLHRRRGLRREPGRSHDIVQGSSSGQASRPQARPSDDNFEVRFTSLARIDDARRPDRQCAQRATIMMPPVDFKGIKAVALRSARSAMGAPATGGQKTDRIRPTQGCYVMSNGLTTRGRIPAWRKGRKVSGATRFCSPKCARKARTALDPVFVVETIK